MIQIILKDGTKKRFNKLPINGWEEFGFSESDIKYQKELTKSDILKIPDTSTGKLVMRDKNAEELQSEQDARQLIIDKADIEKKIQAGIRADAISKHLTAEEVAKIEG